METYGNLSLVSRCFTVCLCLPVQESKSQEVDLLASFSNLRSLVEGPPVNDTDDISRLPPKTATGWSCFFSLERRRGKVVDEGWKMLKDWFLYWDTFAGSDASFFKVFESI